MNKGLTTIGELESKPIRYWQVLWKDFTELAIDPEKQKAKSAEMMADGILGQGGV